MHVTLGILILTKIKKNVFKQLKINVSGFCLKLGDRASIKSNEFEKINWLPIQERVNQCTLSSIYKFHCKNAPEYMDEVFSKVECNGIPTRYSYQKLKLPHRKTNQGLRALSYVGPSL